MCGRRAREVCAAEGARKLREPTQCGGGGKEEGDGNPRIGGGGEQRVREQHMPTMDILKILVGSLSPGIKFGYLMLSIR